MACRQIQMPASCLCQSNVWCGKTTRSNGLSLFRGNPSAGSRQRRGCWKETGKEYYRNQCQAIFLSLHPRKLVPLQANPRLENPCMHYALTRFKTHCSGNCSQSRQKSASSRPKPASTYFLKGLTSKNHSKKSLNSSLFSTFPAFLCLFSFFQFFASIKLSISACLNIRLWYYMLSEKTPQFLLVKNLEFGEPIQILF